jgi:hypothetical protein
MNNRAASRPRSTFQVAGGAIIKYRHPFLSGQISKASPIDEIDVSRSLRLNEQFFDATPAQDSAFQEVLVDGSVVTITNHLSAGTATIQVIQTTGLVGTGDLIAAAHLVIGSKDNTGGTLTVIREIDGKRIVTIFYGVAWKNVPHLRLAGNAVVTWPVTMLYAGWIQGVSGDSAVNEKHIWAVGNEFGLKGVYKPYAIQESENQAEFFGGKPYANDDNGKTVDTGTADIPDVVPAQPFTPMPSGMSGTPTQKEYDWNAEDYL